MALLLIRIDNTNSLPLNEFYDYNGTCYGLSCSRGASEENCINMEEFYEATIDTRELFDVPVVFISSSFDDISTNSEKEAAVSNNGISTSKKEAAVSNNGTSTSKKDAAVLGKSPVISRDSSALHSGLHILGWYRKARVSSVVEHPAFFLEGNIIANASDAVLLPKPSQSHLQEHSPSHLQEQMQDEFLNVSSPSAQVESRLWMRDASYEVVEKEDSRYRDLMNLLDTYKGKNAFLSYARTFVTPDAKVIRNFDLCIEKCQELAVRIMSDECEDLRDIKELELYAKEACSLKRNDPDGYYYHAMACYQLGFLRQGLKSIGKALQLDPDASDLMAQKALLLASKGYREEAAALFQDAFEASGDESYLLWEGKTFLLNGQADKGYDCFRRIEEKKLLDDAGIELKSMEKKWPFIGLRGFKLRDLFRR